MDSWHAETGRGGFCPATGGRILGLPIRVASRLGAAERDKRAGHPQHGSPGGSAPLFRAPSRRSSNEFAGMVQEDPN
jgi:hypothetical protein